MTENIKMIFTFLIIALFNFTYGFYQGMKYQNSFYAPKPCKCGKPADRDGVQCDDCYIRENIQKVEHYVL